MNVKFLNPFVEAACEVIRLETGYEMQRGGLGLQREAYVTDEITVIISLVGAVEGNVFYSMSKATAIRLVAGMMGQQLDSLDALVQSGVAELGNVITGRASMKLADAGYETNISPPTLLLGKGATIYTLDIARVLVPLSCNQLTVNVHLALRTNPRTSASTSDLAMPSAPKLS